MEDIVKRIEQADELQLNEYIRAVVRRYGALRPDRECAFLSLPANPRDDEIDDIIRFICFCYNRQQSTTGDS